MSVASRGEAGRWQKLRAPGAVASAYLPAAASFLIIAALGTAGGGFRSNTWRLTSIAVLAVAAATLVGRDRVEVRKRELVVLSLLAGFVVWTALSNIWSITPSTPLLEAERTLLYLAVLTVVVVGLERAAPLPAIAGVVAGITVVSAVGLGKHYLTTQPINPVEGKLLIEPFGYANALGMYAAIGILLSGGLAFSMNRWSARAAALAPCVVLVPTLLLTSSRGALVALAVGVVAALRFARRIGPVALLALAVIAVPLAIFLGSNRDQSVSPLVLGEQRPHYWHVALSDYWAHPLLGSGAGTFGDYFWRDHRPFSGFSREAHSLYLATLAELGPLGLALLATALILPLLGLRGRQEPAFAAAAGAYVAFLAHLAIDWDWRVTALATTGLFCAGAVLVGTRRGPVTPISSRVRVLLLAAIAALGVIALVRLETAPSVGI